MSGLAHAATSDHVGRPPLDQLYEALKRLDPTWLESTLRAKWEEHSNRSSASLAKQLGEEEFNATHRSSLAAVRLGLHDITAEQVADDHNTSVLLSDHIKRFRSYDWSTTELGPISSWSIELRQMVNLCMYMPSAAALWWGPKRACIFNEAYATVLAERAEWAFGKTVDEVWYDVPEDSVFQLSFAHADTTGLPTVDNCRSYSVQRNGILSEVWASFACQPLLSRSGNLGFFNTVIDRTLEVVRNRRTAMLLELRSKFAEITELTEFSGAVLRCLEPYLQDVPFAAMYQASEPLEVRDITNATRPASELGGTWALAGLLASSSISDIVPSTMDVAAAASLLEFDLPSALETGKIQVSRFEDRPATDALRNKIVCRAWNGCCSIILLIPLRQEQPKALTHFILLGLDPRVVYDEDTADFAALLASNLQIALSSLIIAEDRGRQVALGKELAVSEQRLAEKLDAAEQDNKHMERRFHSMADNSPVGMFEVGADGELKYANDSWFEMTDHPRDQLAPFQWVNTILEDDRGWFAECWSRLVAGETLHFEIRFVKPFISDDYIDGQRLEGVTWASASAYAERDAEGRVLNVLGTTADISRHKWLEGFQERRAVEALELKKQQEAFMDMISHEARNPLAVITLCAENLVNMLPSSAEQWNDGQVAKSEAALDDARTILACATHQKSIIDDVLTLSKINTGMLTVCPVPVQPPKIILETLAGFATAALQANLDLQFITDPSCEALSIDWVALDPVRLQQILINLISNAIKFTKDAVGERRITVTLSAHTVPPAVMEDGEGSQQPVANQQIDGANGDFQGLYLLVAVKDTGCGIKPENLKSLFQRFNQGSLKTHTKYGGSGLGLHICRILASLQGGRIGVSSEHNKGSVFQFFVRTEACAAPSQLEQLGLSAETAKTAGNLKTTSSERIKGHVTDLKQILLVEDNLVNQQVMAKQLRRLGYYVALANHGQEALDYLATTKFSKPDGIDIDLILMDIEMPVMNGLECIKKVREFEHVAGTRARLPVAAVTANARTEQQTVALEAGFDAVITKPFRLNGLQQLLEQFGLYAFD